MSSLQVEKQKQDAMLPGWPPGSIASCFCLEQTNIFRNISQVTQHPLITMMMSMMMLTVSHVTLDIALYRILNPMKQHFTANHCSSAAKGTHGHFSVIALQKSS
jgi:hypothetical protein